MQDLNALNSQEPNSVNSWEMPQKKIEIKQWVFLRKPYALSMDDIESPDKLVFKDKEDMDGYIQELQTLQELLDAPKVEIFFDLNDETDYAVLYSINGKDHSARVSECVTINGVRWHLFPGKQYVPKQIYEYIMSIPDMRKNVNAPKPGEFKCLDHLIGR